MVEQNFIENVHPDMHTVFSKYRRAYVKDFMAMSLLCNDNTEDENERAEEIMRQSAKEERLYERLFDIPESIRREVMDEAERIANKRQREKSRSYLTLKAMVYCDEDECEN